MLTQDISKAFDSISILGLTKSLERLSVPKNIINFISNLFTNRNMNILTAYGTTEIITAGDGIDQGDSISPLLWRIFYDPLLCAVTNYGSRGYNMELMWPHDPIDRTTWTYDSKRIPVSAYMDDTVWLDKSKSRLQNTVDLAHSFFTIWDIKINTNKCELLVINPSITNDQRFLSLGDRDNQDNIISSNQPNGI